MENIGKEHSSRSRPKDMSLEAYKEWIRGLAKSFTSDKGKLQLTEQEWVRSWRDYWKKQSNR